MMGNAARPHLDVKKVLLPTLARGGDPAVARARLVFVRLALSFFLGPGGEGEFNDARAELRIGNPGHGRGLRKQAGFGHAWDGVDFENEWLVPLRKA